ncbi:MAG: YARHG domain-containing protein [Beijerinckiaceae bacterium]
MRHVFRAFSAVAVAAGFLASPAAVTPASAQGYSNMSCSQLWYARNRIYADAGYCFNTARARRQFGAGCFPPYGQLNSWQRQRVNEIQYWERENGC